MEVDDEMIKSKGEEEEEKRKPIVVILVGAPGSGKSTFCDHVMRVSTRPWVRVCQDTIGNGKAGTKAQCLALSNTSLKDDKNILIDRCNLDREQREDFVKLRESHQVDVHAVVLDLSAKVCISRIVKRTGHEGNLQGGKAAAVVNRMLQKKELPKLNEGFTRITFCHNENDVQAAMDTYGALSSSDSLPPGCYGEKKNTDTKVQLGIMKFLKRVDAPNKVISDKTVPGLLAEILKENHPVDAGQDKEMGSESGTHLLDTSPPTLAFPSISTADFQFNIDRASEIIVETVEEFVSKLGNARLVLVDLSHGSKILSLVKTKAAIKNIDPKKFFTFVGDITKLRSEGGLHCNVIANAANWRLKPGGGGVNAAIYNAAGPDLDTATKTRAGSLSPGKAITVPLPSTSSLFSKEGVTHVIHVLGPNMNPKRPNYLKDDYNKGTKVLREAYLSLFENFASIVKAQEKSFDSIVKPDSHSHLDGISNSDQKVRREDDASNTERSKKLKGFTGETEAKKSYSVDVKENATNNGKKSQSMNKDWGSWAQALYNIAMNPEKHRNDVIEVSDDIVVLNDLYPKAQKHVLVLSRAEGLDHLADVREEHLPVLRKMHDVGLKWAQTFLSENESLVFRLGYHSAPSMRQLHLHVISQDFNSKHLKNKKHWNSFNSLFFRDSVDVIEEVREQGKATLNDDEKFMSMELRCNRCRSAHPNIPRLKSHIGICKSSFPAHLLQNGRLLTKGDIC